MTLIHRGLRHPPLAAGIQRITSPLPGGDSFEIGDRQLDGHDEKERSKPDHSVASDVT